MNANLIIPDFLKREPMTPAEKKLAKMRQQERAAKHPGSFLKIPDVRINPRRVQDATVSRRDPTARGIKKDAVTYPTTVALKTVVAGLLPDAKRALFYAIAKENGIDPTRWDHLNGGQVAMNLGNTLRGRYYKNERIVINGKEVE